MDNFLMTECKNATELMLKNDMDIDRVCELIKDYQLKYMLLKQEQPELCYKYDFKMWYKTLNANIL